MSRHRRPPRPDRDRGFTLIELLVTMIVMGILAAIAIPNFMSQRTRGYVATMKSDLRNAATSNEAWAADNAGSYAAPGNLAALRSQGFRPSPDVTVTIVDDQMSGSGGGFCLRAVHVTLGAGQPMFLASTGPTAGSPTDAPCTAS